MSHNLPSTSQNTNLAIICAEHTRRVQHLSWQFWKGNIDLWSYRKLSRELTERLLDEITFAINHTAK
jgi:hypothetical protein